MPKGIPNKKPGVDPIPLEDQQRIAQEKQEKKQARELARQQKEEEIRQRVLAEVQASQPDVYREQLAPVWDLAVDLSVTKQPLRENEKKALDGVGGTVLTSIPEKFAKWLPLTVGCLVIGAIFWKRFFPTKDEVARIKEAERKASEQA